MSAVPVSPGLILTIACPDATGIVAAVSGFLAARDCFIEESSHYGDPDTGRFFMRTVFRLGGGQTALGLETAFAEIADRFAMEWRIYDRTVRQRVMLMVSRFDHCLNDLLYRWRTGALAVDMVGVVSNHPDLEPLARWHDLPFHHLPVTPDTKPQQEAALRRLIEGLQVDLTVLARYMQILSPDLTRDLAGRAINIHHSFLPSFKGAAPYQQAHRRGVKLIGATAHYVTEDLDEGPIIEQAVERVDHTFRVDDLVAVGRDIECVVLARAIKFHAEHRVLLNGRRTVVFR